MKRPIQILTAAILALAMQVSACTDVIVVEPTPQQDTVTHTDTQEPPIEPDTTDGPDDVETPDDIIDTPPDTSVEIDIDDPVDPIDPVKDEDNDGVPSTIDCDDTDPAITTMRQFYADVDGDGYGVDTNQVVDCKAPEGYAAEAGDCNDDDDSVYPGAIEYCDGVDNDCNSATNETNLVTLEQSTLMTPQGKAFVNRTNIETQNKSNGPRTVITLTSGGNLSPVGTPTLKVCEGTHYVDITVNGPARIEGVAKGAKLNGSNEGTIITKTGSGKLTLANIKLYDGVGSGELVTGYYNYSGVGGAVFCDGGEVVLSDTLMASNEANRGGAIFAYECDVTMENGSWLMNNDADFYGGAIWIREANLTIKDSTLAANQVGWVEGHVSRGGAIFIKNGHLDIEDSLLTSNKAISDESAGFGIGGAIYANDSSIICKGGSDLSGFTTNKASSGWGSAIGMNDGSSFVSKGCDFGKGAMDNTGKDIANIQAYCTGNYGCGKDPNFTYTGDMTGPKPSWDAVSHFEFLDNADFTCEWKSYVNCSQYDAGTSCTWRGMECTLN